MFSPESESFMFSLPSSSSHNTKRGHLFGELTSCPFCPDWNTWNSAGLGQGSSGRDLFSLVASLSFLWLTFPHKYSKQGPWTWYTRTPFFYYLIHSIMRPASIHFSCISLFPPLLSLFFSLFLLLALWISKCSIWFPPSLIIEATVIQDLPPSAPSAADPCFSSFLGNQAAYSQASVTS